MCYITYFQIKGTSTGIEISNQLPSCSGEAGVARGGEGVKRTKSSDKAAKKRHLQYWSPTSHFDRMLFQLNDAGNG